MIGLSAEELKKCVDDDMDRAIPYYDSANVTVRHIVYYINVLRTFDNARALYVPTRRLRAQAHFCGGRRNSGQYSCMESIL